MQSLIAKMIRSIHNTISIKTQNFES